MAMDYPYIQIRARTANDSTATVTLKIEEEVFGVDQQAIVDAVKNVLESENTVTSMVATKYEMVVTNTDM